MIQCENGQQQVLFLHRIDKEKNIENKVKYDLGNDIGGITYIFYILKCLY